MDDWFSKNAPTSGGGGWFSKNAPFASNPLSENPKGEGLYGVVKQGQTIKVPFSQIQSAAQQGYTLAPDEIQRYAKDASYAAKSAQPGILEPHEGESKYGIKEILRGSGAGIRSLADVPGMVESGYQTLKDVMPSYQQTPYGPIPVPNVEGLQHGQEQVEEIKKHPGYSAGAFIAPALVTHGLTKVLPKVIGATSRLPRTALEAVTRTSPQDTANIVRDVSVKNAEEVKSAADKTAEQEAQRKIDLKKHFEKTQEAKGPTGTPRELAPGEVRPRTPEELQSHKSALERGVERSDVEIKSNLEKTEETVNKEANRRFNELNASLDKFESDPEKLAVAVSRAVEKIKGSEGMPTILKGLEERLDAMKMGRRHDVPTYEDLQGYRSEIGRELRKGTLPGDVFHAYKGLNEDITNLMEDVANREDQRIAIETGKMLPKEQTFLGKLKSARNYYRQYAEAFIDRDSPIRQALDTKERGEVVKKFQGKDQSGIQRLARYNPDLARRINTVRGLQAEAGDITSSTPNPKPVPKLEPPKPSVEPKTATLTPKTLSELKAKNIVKSAESLRAPNRLASTFLGYDLLRNAFDAIGSAADLKFGTAAKQLLKSVRDVAIRVGYSVGSGKIADLIERPETQQRLARITDGDVQQLRKLTPDQQAALGGEFKPLLDAATKKGVKVSPAFSAWVGTTTGTQANKKKRVAAALTP